MELIIQNIFGYISKQHPFKKPIIIENHFDNDFNMRFTITNQQDHWVEVHKPNTLIETHCPKYIKVILNQKERLKKRIRKQFLMMDYICLQWKLWNLRI